VTMATNTDALIRAPSTFVDTGSVTCAVHKCSLSVHLHSFFGKSLDSLGQLLVLTFSL
jgi:hypothetical protein